MLRYIGIVVSIGLADSLNPSTLAPALYMSSGARPRETVGQFTLAVFLVYLLGGAAIALGPGELILALVPRPDHNARRVLEVIAGGVLITIGLFLWGYRHRLREKQLPDIDPEGRKSWLLGATITAVELPTAFPYFTALAAIIGSDLGLVRQVILIVLFNVCFVLPLLGILATLEFAGDRAQERLNTMRDFMQRHWPVLLAAVALIAGAITLTLGLTGSFRQAKTALRKALS
ncbi:MAG: GAP family protein [Conexibacteraceae bacterium]|nr:GAP family protein [Conexibacteraceae bacterium]